MPNRLPGPSAIQPEITAGDVRAELALLRVYVVEFPDLAALLDNPDLPEDDSEPIQDDGEALRASVFVGDERTDFHPIEYPDRYDNAAQAEFGPRLASALEQMELDGGDTLAMSVDEVCITVHYVNTLAAPLNKYRRAFRARQALSRKLFDGYLKEYEQGKLDAAGLESLLRVGLKGLHITAAVAGKRGWADMTPRDWGIVGNKLRREYNFLQSTIAKLAMRVRSPKQIRADLFKYVAAASTSFERANIARTGIPYDLLPAIPASGDTECRTNCKCWWFVRVLDEARGDYDCSWRLGAAEHCKTCRKRASEWKKIKIRGFRLSEPVPPIVAGMGY